MSGTRARLINPGGIRIRIRAFRKLGRSLVVQVYLSVGEYVHLLFSQGNRFLEEKLLSLEDTEIFVFVRLSKHFHSHFIVRSKLHRRDSASLFSCPANNFLTAFSTSAMLLRLHLGPWTVVNRCQPL